ncbi:penicillin-binding protein activator [Pseudoroseicyclus tamaricis]|uniref:Penicillin-binding protein activator n=1 Tax=Pseudoroseicyclus tamaricis TaxID=2705421 RepID=A0A6B2JN62_9RHOB|nr:penicillin-binding protein activator [Pseudoroseicyclus tamaricis]NDV00107.1 penicillin-binding protein activator [Pseudoroseicyclus tamaricis]
MFAQLTAPGKRAPRLARAAGRLATRVTAILSLAWLAACADVAGGPAGGNAPSLGAGEAVPVALLVPSGSGSQTDEFVASSLENAARLAISDLNGAEIDLRVYPTAASPSGATSATVQAINDGAKIILGPLYAENANAAGVAAAGTGVNVLAFSNNADIAGGNVFILGPTFGNIANRLVSYGTSQGLDTYLVAHGDDLQGQVGRDAIVSAVNRFGGTVAAVQSYALTQADILAAAPGIAAAARSTGADAIFLTAGVNADLPIIATALPDNGLTPDIARYLGLTRWDAVPQALSLPGLQGGLFTLPNEATSSQFERHYSATYGESPHPVAGLAYDGIAAVGALAASGRSDALSRAALTQPQGFSGTQGIFRLLADGTTERGLAVASIQNSQVVILDPAPSSFGGFGF